MPFLILKDFQMFESTLQILKILKIQNKIDFLYKINNEQSIEELLACFTLRNLPEYLAYISKIELLKNNLKNEITNFKTSYKKYIINPTLEIINSPYKICNLLNIEDKIHEKVLPPKKELELIGVYKRNDFKNSICVKKLSNEELLGLKILTDKDTFKDIDNNNKELILKKASLSKVIIPPKSLLNRHSVFISKNSNERFQNRFITADTFTVQWHITHKCDLHCKHCYDRSKRSEFSLFEAEKIIDKINEFASKKNVTPHICLSGGNPFLFDDFFVLYEKIFKNNISVSILGNPVNTYKLKKLNEIQTPKYFQVSLEGLKEHNDFIRGEGNFYRVINFLHELKSENISSSVMLTLTNENIDQILPLAEFLKDKTEYFTFNRLSITGEGASLLLPDKNKYQKFLSDYIKASKTNKIIKFKDNLINITLESERMNLFSGCTGFGCGAAFNFVAILPDGEVHACRKFPSKIGDIFKENLIDIYDSKEAKKYRKRPTECISCNLMRICGGCFAVSKSFNKNIFKTKDSFCFRNP